MSELKTSQLSSRPFVIRPIVTADVPFLKSVIDSTELFPSEMLDEMMGGYFEGGISDEGWVTVDDGSPVAIAYYAPERMTQGTWNLLLIAVHPDRQREGMGTALLQHVEIELAKKGERLLLVETSGLPEFEKTRAFYKNRAYIEEARICDYYLAGEDKIIFRKSLNKT